MKTPFLHHKDQEYNAAEGDEKKDISRVSINIELGEDGIWYSRNMNQITYPEECNDWLYRSKAVLVGFNIGIIA
jgi:hypothetical protein